jgi:DNA-binding beta-propeller fold protein YncE
VSATPADNAVSATIIGEGAFRFAVRRDWARLPQGWSFVEVAAVAVDAQDRVFIFNRGKHPMMVFDRNGNFLRSWGEELFRRPHGLHVGPDGSIYCTDDGDHTVRRCTPDGKVLLELGIPDRPSPYMSGEPFHRCTHTALSPSGDIYVADGYGNARIHKFAPDGRYLTSWGESGAGAGEFNIVHNICCDADGWVYVADRENHRVQIFDGKGRFETQWSFLHRPCALFMGCERHPLCYVGELGPLQRINRHAPNLGPRLSVVTHAGQLLARVGNLSAGHEPGRFIAPHGVAVDSVGDVYVAEVTATSWPMLFPDEPQPNPLCSLQKLVRIR